MRATLNRMGPDNHRRRPESVCRRQGAFWSQLSFDRQPIEPFNHRPRVGEECMSKFLRSRLWWLVLGVSLLGQAFAQGGATGAISGTVQDASGAVVADADVRIINQDTGTVTRVTKTDATGSFTATLLPVGSYTVNVTSA